MYVRWIQEIEIEFWWDICAAVYKTKEALVFEEHLSVPAVIITNGKTVLVTPSTPTALHTPSALMLKTPCGLTLALVAPTVTRLPTTGSIRSTVGATINLIVNYLALESVRVTTSPHSQACGNCMR